MPLSAVGTGIPSAATPTVVAREGAVAAQSTASGPALIQGMAGGVYEQQTVTASSDAAGSFSLSLSADGDASALILANIASGNVATDVDFKAALEAIAGEVRSIVVFSSDRYLRGSTDLSGCT